MKKLFILGLMLTGGAFAASLECHSIDVTFTPYYQMQVTQFGLNPNSYLVSGEVGTRVGNGIVYQPINAQAIGTVNSQLGTQLTFSNGSLVVSPDRGDGNARGSLSLYGQRPEALFCTYR